MTHSLLPKLKYPEDHLNHPLVPPGHCCVAMQAGFWSLPQVGTQLPNTQSGLFFCSTYPAPQHPCPASSMGSFICCCMYDAASNLLIFDEK